MFLIVAIQNNSVTDIREVKSKECGYSEIALLAEFRHKRELTEKEIQTLEDTDEVSIHVYNVSLLCQFPNIEEDTYNYSVQYM